MDLLDDDLFLEPAVTNARGGGKFQPKIKPRPKKLASAPISSTLPNAEKKQPALVPSSSLEKAQIGQPVDVVDDKLRNLVGSSTDALGISETDEPVKEKEVLFSDGTRSLELNNSPSEVNVVREDISLENAETANVAIFDCSILESAGQVESMEFDLDPFDDILPHPTTKNGRASGKFQPKVNPKAGKDLSRSVASDISMATKENLANSAGTIPNMPNDVVVSSIAASEIQGDKDGSGNCRIVNASPKLDAGVTRHVENAILDGVACSAGESADIFLGLEGLEDFTTQPSSETVHTTSKTHHETPNLHASSNNKDMSGIPVDGSVDSSAFMVCQVAQSDTSFGITQDPIISTEDCDANNEFGLGSGTEGRGVISDFERDNMPMICVTSDPHVSLAEASQLDDPVMNDALQSDDIPLAKMVVKRIKRKNSTVSENAQKSRKSSAVGEKEQDGKSSRQLRKCSARQLIDESDEEARDNSVYDAETPGNSAAVEVEDGNDEWREGDKSKKKRAPRKKPVAEAEKPARKRKKANNETDQSADQPPKKFSHSTRCTRRQVDKALLETPEEELELTNMPMKDLIMFYLHKEKMESKETKSKKPSTNPSTQNDASHNEEEVFGTNRNSYFTDNQGGDPIEMTNPHFNYQTYMDKTRSVKWSKQDDELFYKGVRQFGIDLSMIQLLFPDRTRRQIKLKLKKEERQHPLRLTEAVQNRATDHSHFELIIEQFKKAKAEEEEEFDGSESIGVTGEEDAEDVSPENNDEATKPEEEETGGNNGNEAEAEETAKVESPLQFDEIEDDFDIDDYRSEY